ncbi:MAG: right-handed parallel beta-helix repeat-containing protein [Ardenticatenaceae bacterium]|nr:right-handed parallel beta-helix repeat-containing protein [Ardenticatenaceae bacterium]
MSKKDRLKTILYVLMVTGGLMWVAHGHLVNQPVVTAAGATLYVSANGNCGSASPCYAAIQAAVDAAAAGDEIKIAAGSYTLSGSQPGQVVQLTKGVTLTGGFASANWSTADPQANPTIVNAQGVFGRRVIDVNIPNFPGSLPFRITGLIIEGGNGDATLDFDGGGVYVQSGNGTIEDNIVRDNKARHGGGIYVISGNVSIRENLFEGNEADRGGGLWLNGAVPLLLEANVFRQNEVRTGGGAVLTGQVTARGNLFEDNMARSGGAVFAGQLDQYALLPLVTLIENQFESNNGEFGGAVNLNSGAATLTGNSFLDNFSSHAGGAVYVTNSNVDLNNNDFVGNEVRFGVGSFRPGGSAVFVFTGTVRMNGNLIFDNLATIFDISHSEALRIELGSVTSQNDIFASNLDSGNTTTSHSAITVIEGSYTGQHISLDRNVDLAIKNEAGSVHLSNSIISQHNAAFGGPGITSETNLFYQNPACVSGPTCINSLSGTPQYVNALNGDLHLQPTSAAIDQAAGSTVAIDFDGDARPQGAAADVGADEYLCGRIITDLRVTSVITGSTIITAMLSWTPDPTAVGQEVRTAAQPLTTANWGQGIVVASGIPTTTGQITSTVPFSGDTVYWALRSTNICGDGPVSRNAFWPSFDSYLPVVER